MQINHRSRYSPRSMSAKGSVEAATYSKAFQALAVTRGSPLSTRMTRSPSEADPCDLQMIRLGSEEGVGCEVTLQ